MNYSTFRSKLPPILLLYFLSLIGFKVAAQSGKVFRDNNGKRGTDEPYNLFTLMRNFLLSLHNKQQKSVLYGIFLTLLLFLSSGLFVLQAQTTVCKEFIYLNSGNFDPNTAKIHKFQVGSSGPFTEVIVNNDAWYPGASGIDPSFNYPHGLGVDRNGFLYIGNAVFSPNAIRRFDCVGNLKPASEFEISNPGELLTNIDSYAGFIYSNGGGNKIYKWDPCTGAAMGYVQLDDGSLDWGFSIDDNGKFYVTNTSGKIYVFTPTAANFTSNTTYNPVINLGANPTQGGALSPQYAFQGLQGITTDNAGNIYVVEGNRDSPGTPSRLLKFSPTFTFLAASPIDSDGSNGAGWNQMVGVVYSTTTSKLYTSSLNAAEDCLYSFDTNLTPVVAVVGPDPTGLGGKGLNILKECCPTSGTIDKSVCGVTIGERISLSDLISTDGGVICDGQWTQVGTATGLTFNQCDLTVTVTGNTACGTFKITNKNTPNKTCADYEITLNVSLLPQVTAQVIAGNQSVCPEDNPTAFTITTAAFTIPAGGAITYQWQSSTTSATAGFTNIVTGGNGATYDSNPISQTTYFRVIASVSGCSSGNCRDTSNVVTVTVKTDCAPPVPKPTGWNFTCEQGVTVETVGKAGFGVSNPSASCTGSGTATIALANGATADSIYIEAVYKTTNPGPSITFVANSTNYVAQRYQLPLGDAWVYRTKVPATASISMTDGTKFCALQSLVAYVFRKSSGKASVGVFTCEQGYQSTVTVNIPLPTLTKASDVTVCVPISELTNDGRLLTIRATAGTIVKDTVISGSDPAFGACCLAIPKLKLVNVPAGTTTVKVEVISANSPAGQSFTVASAISANVECEKCVKPVAAVSPKTQTVCVGGTATAFTATPSTGVEYKWYGPLTNTTGSLGTAIAGQTAAAFTPTGAALTTEGTKYYAVVVNTTGDVTCADTAFVTLVVSKITVPAATAQCHANGTPEDASDDYMTFSIKVTTTPISLNKFTVTATQGGSPLAITLSNGSPATTVNCGLNTPLRTPAGSAGKGNVTLTITDNTTGCTTTLVITDPGTCASVCVTGTPTTVMYEYATQTDITDLDKLPIIIPKFDEQGGTRVLKSVKLEYIVGGKTTFVFENRAAQSQTFEATGTSEAYIELNGSEIATAAVAMPIPETTLPGGILVPAQGSWSGDTVQGSVPTTLGRMSSWVSDYLTVFKDPRIDPRWVTNATGDATDDDDMFFAQMVEDTASGSFTYTTAGALAPFIGTGSVPLNVSTLSGLTLAGGGGNIFAIQRTRACASAKVTYTYECVTLCTPPTRLVRATDPTCTVPGKIELVSTNGDKYGVSKGATYTGPAYATATAVPGTLPVLIKGNISHEADSTWTIRVFNAANDCFKDTTVTVKAAPVKPTITQQSGSPVCRNNGTTYTIKFTATGGTVVTTPSFPVTGDSIANIPIATANVKLVITSAGGCKDSITITAPNCLQPKGSLGDYVWKDTNNNGIQDEPASAGVANVQVELYKVGTTAAIAKDTTDASGKYLFTNLDAGQYNIKVLAATLPAGCTISTKKDVTTGGGTEANDSDVDPTTGQSGNYTIDPTDPTKKDILTVDAALFSPKGSLGDYVWKDTNNNGIQDEPASAGVANVQVELYKVGTTAAIAKDTTDASGKYLFTNLDAGQYNIKVLAATLPAGCTISTKKDVTTGGGTEANDSDVDPTTGQSGNYTIDPTDPTKKDILTVDAALFSPKGSLGDYVWKDTNNNGIQDEPASAGVANVQVELYKVGTTAAIAKDTTDASGKYLFTNLDAGQYNIKVLAATLPAGCTISTKKDVTTGGGTEANDSDVDPTTGQSGNYTIDPLDPTKKDILTVDAALFSPCVKPNAGPDQTLICGTTAPTTVNLADALAGQKWKVLSVQPNTTVSVTTPAGLVTGMTAPGQYLFVLQTQSDSLACRDTVSITVPDCSCPQVNILTPNATVCKDSLFPTLDIALIGSNTQGVGAAWYANATGGNPLGTGLSFKPTGVASVTDTFYVALTGASANCLALPRTPVIVTVQNCTVEVDLALRKSINKKIAQIGDELTYTVKVFNQLNTAATGVEVTDSIATTVQFVTGSFVASRGSAVINGNVIKWTIGGIAANAGANGDTVTLTYRVKATQEGVHFNTAEISKTNEKDIDSTPGNGTDGEDDIESQCFTVPFKLCPGEKVQVNVPAFLTNVQWFKNGGTTSVGTGNEILFSEAGSYSFTATNQACPANGCCPVIIEPGDNCCPDDLCIPFTIKKTKKK